MEKEETNGHGVLIAVLIVIFVYVFIPYVFALPLMALEESGVASKGFFEKAEVIFLPLEYLSHKFPPYERLIDAEGEIANKLMGGH